MYSFDLEKDTLENSRKLNYSYTVKSKNYYIASHVSLYAPIDCHTINQAPAFQLFINYFDALDTFSKLS